MQCTVEGCPHEVYTGRLCRQHTVTGAPGINSTKPVKQSLAVEYPKYYKAVPEGVDAIDTYTLNQMFPVDDPSGCILHARKKLLVPGVRSGGKSFYKDVKEARDTLNRWLELNPEPQ